MNENGPRTALVPAEAAGERLDRVLARLFPDYSRTRLQQWLREGRITVDGARAPLRMPVVGGEAIELRPAPAPAGPAPRAEPIPLAVVHEDDDLIVLNKAAGLVVHPAAGHASGTLVNALLARDAALAALPRAGIVHRLDKDTTGLMVVARNLRAHKSLVEQLQARSVSREYLAVVAGVPVSGSTVDALIGRHPRDRKRMAVGPGGKPAVTHFRIADRFRAHALVRASLETGRTHQIRVHLAHAGYPVVGDPAYGARPRLPPKPTESVTAALRGFRRQALHAARLSFIHPASGGAVQWEAPLPADMEGLLAALREDRDSA